MRSPLILIGFLLSLVALSLFARPGSQAQTVPPTATLALSVYLPVIAWPIPTPTPTRILTDTVPPRLFSLSFKPPTVNTWYSHKSIIVEAHIVDDFSGFLGGLGTVEIDPPSGPPIRVYFRYPYNLVSGTAHDGIYQSEISLPRRSGSGNWVTAYVELIDKAGNDSILITPALIAAGFEVLFRVVNEP